jgi:tRNA threonylcarbamoyladenosine biosynthesis protein TsaB
VNILALDTSTHACSAALSIAGVTHERFELAPRGHTQLILPMLDNLLSEAGFTLADIDAIAFGCGPGAFTGLRIAAGIAQGIAFGANLPVLPISSLAALAQGARRKTGASHVLAALDARMGELYWGAYQCDAQGIMMLQGNQSVCSPDFAPLPAGGKWLGVGSGWDAYGPALLTRLSTSLCGYELDCYPRAQDIAFLADAKFGQDAGVKAADALPVYLRNEIAWGKIPQ